MMALVGLLVMILATGGCAKGENDSCAKPSECGDGLDCLEGYCRNPRKWKERKLDEYLRAQEIWRKDQARRKAEVLRLAKERGATDDPAEKERLTKKIDEHLTKMESSKPPSPPE